MLAGNGSLNMMNRKQKEELIFIAFCILSIIASVLMMGCAHIQEKEYFESGQLKKDTEKYGILFSEGKEFSLIEIN